MKYYLLILTILFQSINAFALSKKTLTRLKNACVCHIEVLDFQEGLNDEKAAVDLSLSNSLNFSKDDKFSDCVSKAIDLGEEIFLDETNVALTTEKQRDREYKKRLSKASKEDNAVVCTKKEVKDWYKTLKKGVKNKPAVYKALIDQNICGGRYCETDVEGKISVTTINLAMDKIPSNVALCTQSDAQPIQAVKTCRKGLENLTLDNKEAIYESCKVDLNKLSKRERLANKCVELNLYKTIYFHHYEEFEKQYCISKKVIHTDYLREQRDVQDSGCRDLITPIHSKIFTLGSVNRDEVKECENTQLFNTKESQNTCRSILISKVLGFHTNKEKLGLYACIMNGQPATMDTVINEYYGNSATNLKAYVQKIEGSSPEECFSNYLSGGNADEEEKLKEIEEKYCAQEVDEKAKKDCVKQILSLFMNDLEIPKKCKLMESEVEKQKCIREALYEKILAADELNSGRCWDQSVYPDVKARSACLDSALKFKDALKQCYPDDSKPLTFAAFKCLENTLDISDPLQLQRLEDFLKNKAAKIDPDKYKKCLENASTGGLWNCLNYITDQGTSKDKPVAGAYGAEYCIDEPDFYQCLNDYRKKLWEEKKITEEGTGPGALTTTPPGPGTNNTDIVSKDLNTNGDVNGDGTNKKGTNNNGATAILTNAGISETTLLSNAGNTPKDSGKKGNGINPMDLTDNSETRKKQFFGILRDFKYIGLKGKKPPCKSLRKAAWVRMGSLVLGLGTITFAGIKAAKHIKKGKEENKGQKASWEAAGMVLGATAGAVGMRALGNMWAKNIVEQARTQELTRLATPEPPPEPYYCQKAPKTKTSFFLHDFNKMKLTSKVSIAAIKKAKSHKDVNLIFSEWESYYQQEEIQSPKVAEAELESLFDTDEKVIPLDMLKKTLIASIESLSGLFISKAYATQEESGMGDFLAQNGSTIKSFLPTILDMAGKEKEEDVGNKTNNNTTTSSKANATVAKEKNSRALSNTINKKLDGDLSKYQAIDLLTDYGITLGTDMPEFEKAKLAADKNLTDFNVIKENNNIETENVEEEEAE